MFDEGTVSLDVENETAVQSALLRFIKDKTVLLIAHRMRTVAGADKIFVMSDGMSVEQGSPDAFMKKNGIYSQMVNLQTESKNRSIE